MTTATLMQNRSVVVDPSDGVLPEVKSWDFTSVRQYLQFEYAMPEEITLRLENEYKKFISALVMDRRFGEMPISEPVDQFWHTHILFTRDYTRFCQTVAGDYIHHTPTTSSGERDTLETAYKSVTLPTLTQHFGQLDETLWPPTGQVCLGG